MTTTTVLEPAGPSKGTVTLVHLYPREMSIYGDLVQRAPSRQLPPEIAQRRAAAAISPSPGGEGRGEGNTTVDGRPAAAPENNRGMSTALRPPTATEFEKRPAQLARQAAAARQLNNNFTDE